MSEDRVLWRRDLRLALDGVTDETVRRWIKQGKLPKPDIDLSLRTRGWRLSTLRRAGIKLAAASPPTLATSDA
jgi:hypothetical protein